MMARRRQMWLPVAVVIAAACSASMAVKRDTIRFSHGPHIEEDLACGDCHGSASRRLVALRPAFPRMKQCVECHDAASEEDCRTCHTNVRAPSTWDRPPPRDRLFSHQQHHDETSGCADCHGQSVSEQEPQWDPIVPGPAHCRDCHGRQSKDGRCRLTPFGRHGRTAAAGGQQQCAVCHDQSFCADCHAQTTTVRPSLRMPERVDRTFMHRGDWESRHVMEARVGGGSCTKCHGGTFCSSCHERKGVGTALRRRNPHPAGWLASTGANSHSRAARRRIAECASCHDRGPASKCVQCHRSGGRRPHPPGWRSPIPESEKTTHEMCRICHSP